MKSINHLELLNTVQEPVGEKSLIKFRDTISTEAVENSPIFRICLFILEEINKKGFLKLTTKGNLQVVVVKAINEQKYYQYNSGSDGILNESGKEEDFNIIHLSKIILQISGIVKKQHDKLSFTQKGKKLFANQNKTELFQELFLANANKFNWGYFDGFSDPLIGQMGWGITIWGLLVAEFPNSMTIYSDFYEKALSVSSFKVRDSAYSTKERQLENAFIIRTFWRFLHYWGMLDLGEKLGFMDINKTLVNGNVVLRGVFELNNKPASGWTMSSTR